MIRSTLILAALAVTIAAVLTGCGGSSSLAATPVASFELRAWRLTAFTVEELPRSCPGGPYVCHQADEILISTWWPGTADHFMPTNLGITKDQFTTYPTDPKMFRKVDLLTNVWSPRETGRATMVGDYTGSPYNASVDFIILPVRQ